MARIDLVDDSCLETHVEFDLTSSRAIPKITTHTYYGSEGGIASRMAKSEEVWNFKGVVGQGSYGTVYHEVCTKGRRKSQHRAVKQISKSGVVHYERELEAIAKFSHPKYRDCFVESFGWYNSSDFVFISMEWLEKGDLHAYLYGGKKERPVPESQAQQVVSQLLEGLKFMHENGFAHRDLKPSNVLLKSGPPDWWVKLSDFGISKRNLADSLGASDMKGTEAFIPPEIWQYAAAGRPLTTLDYQAADIWALGETTFQMMAVKNTFDSRQEFVSFEAGEVPFPSDLLAGKYCVTREGQEFVKSLMRAQPWRRPTASQAIFDNWIETAKPNSPKGLQSLATRTLSASIEAITSKTENIQLSQPLIGLSMLEESVGIGTWDTPKTMRSLDSRFGYEADRSSHYRDETHMLSERMTSASQTHNAQVPSSGGHDSPSGEVPHYDSLHPTGSIRSISFSNDSERYLWVEKGNPGHYGGGKDHVQLRSINTKSRFLVDGGVDGAQYSPDGHMFLWYNSDEISIWDITGARLWNTKWSAGARPVKSFFSHMRPIAISPDSKMVAVGIDQFILCWDIVSGKLKHTLPIELPGFQELRSISILPSGDMLAAGDWEDSSTDQPNIIGKKSFWLVWQSLSHPRFHFLHERFHIMAISVNRMSVAFLTPSMVGLFDISTGDQKHILQGATHSSSSFDQLALLVLPDTVFMTSIDMAIAKDGVQVKTWDLQTEISPCRIITLPVSIQSDSLLTSVAFSLNGETLAFGKSDGCIHRLQTDFSRWKEDSSQDNSESSQDEETYFEDEENRLPGLESLFTQ